MDTTAARRRLRARPADPAGIVVAVLFGAALAAAAWARHANYWSGGFDLGIFDQAVWLLSRGHEPEVTIIGRSIFADHFSPVLLLFVPLYRLAATPLWLLAAQGLALAATVVPLRALARDHGIRPAVPTAVVVLSAPLWAGALYDFHPTVLAAPFIAWAVLAGHRGDGRAVTLAGVAVVLCRGDLGWVLLALVAVARPPARIRLAAVGMAGLVLSAAVPAAFGAHGHWEVHYGHLGSGPLDAALHPWRVLDALATQDAYLTLVLVLLPVGFLAAVRPRWAVAIVVSALPLMISQHEGTHVPWFHYGAPLVPVAVAGALEALAGPLRHPRHLVVLGLGVGTALLLASPLSPRAPDEFRLWNVLRPEEGVRAGAAVEAVRPGEAVVAVNRILPHLTHRREVWPWPAPFVPVVPAGIGPDPDAEAARRVSVAVVSEADEADARRRGFEPTGVDAGRLYVGRRPVSD